LVAYDRKEILMADKAKKLLKSLFELLKGKDKDGKKKERKIMIKKTIRW